jgi:diketogulonate reductase-like aldo/keto reductase
MRYETLPNLQLPKIGFGTWRIGNDRAADERSRLALRSALELGYTHFDTAEAYAAGHAEELLGQVVREMKVPRHTLFITSKVSPEHLKPADVQRCCENSLRRLGMDYLDLYLIHWPGRGINLEETFQALNRLVQDGKVRHLGVSNFNLKLLQKSVTLCKTPLLTDKVPYSVPDRTYVENGVLEYCQHNDILLTAYTPVNHRMTNVNQTLQSIARAHDGITPAQVSLAWLVAQPRVITIPMSANPQHQAENIQAADIVLDAAEMELLNRLF